LHIIPPKTCSLDCVYCEAGATTSLTITPTSFYPVDDIIREIFAYLKNKPTLDFITFSGFGEPTLNADIGKIILYIKARHPHYKLCLITNATLLSDTLIDDICHADVVMPSLDAVSEQAFSQINRPHPDLSPELMIDSLIMLREKFGNMLWLETFFLEGINDSEGELALLKEAYSLIKPDKILLNSLDRGGLYPWVKKMPLPKLQYIKNYLYPLNAEIII
jgi:wyosine [tRNA(Phe)-imidazoG37] synthetase (radical SAM superfamily)